MTTTPTITIRDRNEVKFLMAIGFDAIPIPQDTRLNFEIFASEELFEARRAFSLNQAIPVQSFIQASLRVERLIFEHRCRQGGQKLHNLLSDGGVQ